jgi:hypothetical protein
MSQKENPKKERVLHTRISDALDRELRDRAAELGVSVSKLVRNALLTTVDLVENIVADSARVAENATNLGSKFNRGDGRDSISDPPSAAKPTSPAPIEAGQIIGWQELTLNLNAICVQCNDILAKGTKAAMGLTLSGGSTQVLCESCLTTLHDSEETNPS